MLKKKKKFIYYKNNLIIIKKIYYNSYYNKLEFFSKFGKLYYLFSKQVKLKLYKKKKYIKIEKLNKKWQSLLNLYYILIKNCIFSITGGYFIKIILKGRGYSIYISKKKKILEFKLGYSHIIKIYLSNNIILKKINKLKFLIYSLYYEDLKNFSYFIKNYKKINIYKGKGLFFDKEKIILKEGKKKY